MTKELVGVSDGGLNGMEANLNRRFDLLEVRLSREIEEVRRSKRRMKRSILIALSAPSLFLALIIPLAGCLVT